MWAVVEMKRVFHFHGRSRPEYEVEKCVQLLKSGTVTNPPNESLFSHCISGFRDMAKFVLENTLFQKVLKMPKICGKFATSQKP